MRTDPAGPIDAAAIDERTLEPAVTFLPVVGALFLLWALVSALPGVDRYRQRRAEPPAWVEEARERT